ncbi:hypothetical protein CY35_06G097100 [Sphagnum magellanicum]|nr:hypothetical protein CY35_06G097100 [Sphagnum magellanicum]
MRYDHNRGMSCLEDTWISKENARQRWGCAGRVHPGCCLWLFSRKQFQKLDEQLPEMLRVSLEGLCLRVKSLLPGKVEMVVSQMLTPPSIDNGLPRQCRVISVLSTFPTLGFKPCIFACPNFLYMKRHFFDY